MAGLRKEPAGGGLSGPRAAGLAVAVAGFVACSVSTRKLDEATLHRGPQFELKVVRYYERYPFHYVGEVFTVQCGSSRTAGSPGHMTQEPGWVTLAAGGAIGSRSAAELVERESEHLRVIDDQTLIWVGSGVQVSFDACGRFASWYPWSLPPEWIVPAEKPAYCAPKGSVDCRNLDFQGEREARFDAVLVRPGGSVSFVVRSQALVNERGVRVESADQGRTWSVEPL